MSANRSTARTTNDNSQAKTASEPQRMRQRTPRAERAAAIRLAQEAVREAGNEVRDELGCIVYLEEARQMTRFWQAGAGMSALGEMLVLGYRLGTTCGAVRLQVSVDACWRIKRDPALGRRLATAIRTCAARMVQEPIDAVCAVDLAGQNRYMTVTGRKKSAPPDVQAARDMVTEYAAV